MIKIYEKSHPAPIDSPHQYKQLYMYAINRLEKCRYGEQKPACKRCPIHCYQPKMREEMKTIMRWSGPKMLIYHPILAIKHLLDDRKPIPKLPERIRKTIKNDR